MRQHLIAYIIISFIIFGLFSITYPMGFMRQFDTSISDYVKSFHTISLTYWFEVVSKVGSMTVYIPVSIILVIYYVVKKRYISSIFVLVSLHGSRILNQALKSWYERPRPDIHMLITASGYSFPSGHAMNATAFLGFMAYLTITEHRLSLWQKIILIIITGYFIFSVALSRVYLGVHYPTDVLAGIAAGLGWMFLCVLFHYKLQKTFLTK